MNSRGMSVAAATAFVTAILYIWRRRRGGKVDAEAVMRKQEFLKRAGHSYGFQQAVAGCIDAWRREELPGLIAPLGQRSARDAIVYLDHAGGALPTASQLASAAQLAGANAIVGNPHSTGPAAAAGAAALETARHAVLKHFCGEHAHEWELIWTSGATAALRMAAEAFPFSRGQSQFLYTHNAHTSVLGMRTVAAAAGASWTCVPLEKLHAAACGRWSKINREPSKSSSNGKGSLRHHLAVLPLECNLTGDRLPDPQALIDAIDDGEGSDSRGRWWVMLDAAKAAATSYVDVPATGAALCCVSLYKLFGEPTGLGALLVRADLAKILHRRSLYFGGGSVASVLASEDYHVPKPSLVAALTGGTPHYRGALSVPAGFETIQRLGGMHAIEMHCSVLADELERRLRELKHANGASMVEIYGNRARRSIDPVLFQNRVGDHVATEQDRSPVASAEAWSDTGPTVAFNLRRQDGSAVGYAEVLKLAALHTPPIQLRGGCCCNPGGCQRALGLTAEDVRSAAASGKQCGDDFDLLSDGRPTGVVRASLGKDSIWEDIDALVTFLATAFVGTQDTASRTPHPERSSVPATFEARLGSVYVYPIKSCAAFGSDRWWMDRATGRLLLDREWALLDGRGEVMRLHAYPQLARIRPCLNLVSETMTLHADGLPPHVLSLRGDGTGAHFPGDGAAIQHISVCLRDCAASGFGGEATARWLSRALGVHCKMVRHGGDHRCVAEDANGKACAEGVAFANEAPLLVLTQAAVDKLNLALKATGEPPVCTRHFRPNLVIAGQRVDAEDEAKWQHITLANGDVRLRVTGPCARCSMVEIDPTSGQRHGAVLRALAKHHRVGARLLFGFFCKVDKSNGGEEAHLRLKGKESQLVELKAGSRIEMKSSAAPFPDESV